ncbi:hypothetical protein [Alienimonas chondri]|uniref:Uncharacterized protein n=1 Tax=Alienimonas chondri TaxID=2681879 RepID=A0ABX1VG16_9PLAN|nr:hypothetical protein [Alienimonas chondri]NNJ27044.1 hypothetical protein [Alienimonas chondri]
MLVHTALDRRFGGALALLAASLFALSTLTGCEGSATVAGANGPQPAGYAAAPATPPATAPVAPTPAPAVRDVPTRRPDPRTAPPRENDRDPERRSSVPRSSPLGMADSGDASNGEVVKAPGADPFDPDIDPSTLTRPEPVVDPVAAAPPELKDYPLTAAIPADKQAIPADLALPAGTVLYHQEGRGWTEVELKADAPAAADAVAENLPPLRVHRTDRPAIIPDVLVPRDQLVIPKVVVRRLRMAR